MKVTYIKRTAKILSILTFCPDRKSTKRMNTDVTIEDGLMAYRNRQALKNAFGTLNQGEFYEKEN